MIRYRTDMDRQTGELLLGFPAVEQSIGLILTTLLEERVMRLDFGSELIRRIGRNMSVPVVLAIYRDAVKAIHAWEPEYRVVQVQLMRLERTGAIALGTKGLYYPEGRFGRFDLVEAADGAFPLAQAETLGRAA